MPQRRTTAIALVLVLVIGCAILLPRFATLLSTTCGTARRPLASLVTTPHARTNVASGEQNIPASASEPAPAPAFVPAPAADHVQSRQGGQVERTCRSDCRRSPPSATAVAAADILAVEVHGRCIQGDGPWDDDAHLLSAPGNSTYAQVPAEALASNLNASPLVKRGFA